MRILRLDEVTKDTVLKYDCTPEELEEAYRLAREAFTAADLQKFTEPTDDFIPFEDVLRDLDEQQARLDAQRRES